MSSRCARCLWLAGLLLLAGGHAAATVPARAAEDAPQAPREHRIDVRGAAMRFVVHPGGEPVVVLEAGSGLGADAWDRVAPALAAATGATVVAYDRAGMGGSDGLGTPYDVRDEVARLHAGLQALGLDRRVVLVGHSYGGYLVQLYANLYPDDVHGLVYVDANTVAGIDALGGPGPIARARIRANDVPDPDKAQAAGLRLSRALEATHETLRRHPPVCGVPVAVLAAGERPDGMTAARFAAWQDAQRELAARTGGRFLIAEGSGHLVPRDRPDAVVDAVRAVLAAAGDAHATPGRPGASCPAAAVPPSDLPTDPPAAAGTGAQR
ncbi:alpha/beta hydrolase [Luteimonas sp. Y-2-2-4F]|nr:alpha/beta hydrolase [Luteimonas sp. Y-2-2-4F]MCD9032052.1 alpha/beta hydrolase [Luteimonas sp. Y-2-2-4F]